MAQRFRAGRGLRSVVVHFAEQHHRALRHCLSDSFHARTSALPRHAAGQCQEHDQY